MHWAKWDQKVLNTMCEIWTPCGAKWGRRLSTWSVDKSLAWRFAASLSRTSIVWPSPFKSINCKKINSLKKQLEQEADGSWAKTNINWYGRNNYMYREWHSTGHAEYKQLINVKRLGRVEDREYKVKYPPPPHPQFVFWHCRPKQLLVRRIHSLVSASKLCVVMWIICLMSF